MTQASSRSASAARQGGDAFQHLVAWTRILRALPLERGLRVVELEAVDVGNVDDVVVRCDSVPDEFTQVRYGVRLETPLNSDYLTKSTQRGTSLLQKFYESWNLLGGTGTRPVLQLLTNRAPDPHDPIFSQIDGRTSSLGGPLRAAPSGSDLGVARLQWAEHLGVNEGALLAMLDDLRFRTGCQYANEHEHAADLMLAAGLRNDANSVNIGIDLVRQWVLDGHRHLTVGEVREGIDRLGLRAAAPAATLLVQAIDLDHAPQDADEALDWVHRYEGSEPKARRKVVSADAYADMHSELRMAADRLIGSGHRRVVVRGPMRLATWFAGGEALSEVRGVVVTCGQNRQQWSSDEGDRAITLEVGVAAEPESGEGLAVALAFAADPTADVIAFVNQSDLPVRRVLRLGPPDGRRVSSGAEATGYVLAIKDAVRQAIRETKSQHVHLFMAAPAGLALLLGHRWNRMAATTLWEDLGGVAGYAESYTFVG